MKSVYSVWFAICIAILAIAGAQVVISADIKENTDLKYAQRLAEQGHFEIAEDICSEVMKITPAKEIKAQAQLIVARIKKMQAQRVRDSGLLKQLKDESVKILKDIIEGNVDGSVVADAEFEISEILMEHAARLDNAIKKERDADNKVKLRQELENTYVDIFKYHKDMLVEFNGRLVKEKDPMEIERLKENIMEASYQQAITFYYYGITHDKSGPKFKYNLEEAIKYLKKFTLEYGDTIRSYDASYYCGLCYHELGNYEKAKEYFDMASYRLINAIKSGGNNADSHESLPESLKENIQKAFWHYARTANANGEYKLAIQIVDSMRKAFPKSENDYYMKLALLEQLYARYKTGNKESLGTIRTIAEGSGIGAKASKEMIGKIVESEIDIPNDLLLLSADNLFDDGKYAEAIKRVQVLMSRARDIPSDDRIKLLPKALLIMGESFRLQKPPRYYEAIIAYESIYLDPKFTDVKIEDSYYGAKAMSLAAYCHLLMSIKGDDTDGKKRKNELRDMLIKSWPDSPEAKEIRFDKAEDLKAEEKYMEAAESYGQVPDTSQFYIDAKFNSGYMHYLQVVKVSYPSYLKEASAPAKTKLGEDIVNQCVLAEQKFRDFIKFAEESGGIAVYTNADKSKLRRYALLCYTCLGRLYLNSLNKKYADVFALMESANKKFKTLQDRAEMLQITVEALINTGRIIDAEQLVKDFAGVVNDPVLIAPIAQLMAFGYEEMADKIVPPISSTWVQRLKQIDELRNNDKDKYQEFKQLLTRSREYYAQWVNTSTKLSGNDALGVADRLYMAAEELKNSIFYTQAADIYKAIKEGKLKDTLPAAVETIGIKHPRCYIKTQKWIEALPLLVELDNLTPNNKTIKIELALTYTELGNSASDVQKNAYWNNARQIWLWLAQQLEQFSQDWWNARYYLVLIDYNAGRYAEAYKGITNLEITVNKDFDEDKWGFKIKFLDLKKRLKDIMPK